MGRFFYGIVREPGRDGRPQVLPPAGSGDRDCVVIKTNVKFKPLRTGRFFAECCAKQLDASPKRKNTPAQKKYCGPGFLSIKEEPGDVPGSLVRTVRGVNRKVLGDKLQFL